MNNLSDQVTDLFTKIKQLQARTHAEIGIVGAAIIEEKLARSLLKKMRPLGRSIEKQIFDGYGPLSSFSAKIDISYALRIIDKKTYDDLTIVRKIRNKFAHSMWLINFENPEIVELFKQFKLPKISESNYQLYY